MARSAKRLAIFSQRATYWSTGLAAAMALLACRSANTNSASKDVFNKDPAAQKLEAEVASFDEIRTNVNEMNRNPESAAATKLATIWDRIVATKQDDDKITPAGAGAAVVVFGNGSVERFWRIFTGWAASEGGSEVRPNESVPDILKKYIRLTHRYSVFAKLKYVPTEAAKARYTGHYATGNDSVLGRFSSAVPPSVPDRFTPAFSSKFFINGKHESQVLITQHDVGGQSVGKDRIYNNYFEKALSNRLAFEKDVPSGVGAFSRFLYTAMYFSKALNLPYVFDPRELQADHLAEYTPDGQTVASPKGPRFVWTVAGTPELRSYFAGMDKPGADYRAMFLSLNKSAPVNGAGSQAGGIAIMKVYGSDKWTNNPTTEAELIGEFVTTSPFVASDAADQRLFFRHSISFFHYNGVDAPKNRRFEVRVDKGINLQKEVASGAYTKDYPWELWSTREARDQLFTTDCRLGVKEDEVTPFPFRHSLNGTFIAKSIVSRKDAKGEYCAPTVIGGLVKRATAKAPESEIPAKSLDQQDTTLDDEEKNGIAEHIKKMFDYSSRAGGSL